MRDPAVIDHWVNHIDYQRCFPLVAEAEGRIVGDGTLHMRKVGWKRHLGNVRVVVAKDYQGRGLGTLLINELVELAGEFGLEKLIAEIHLQAVGRAQRLQESRVFGEGGVRRPGQGPHRPQQRPGGHGLRRPGPG